MKDDGGASEGDNSQHSHAVICIGRGNAWCVDHLSYIQVHSQTLVAQ